MDSTIVAALIGVGATLLGVAGLWLGAERKHKNEVKLQRMIWEYEANRVREEAQAAMEGGDQARAEQLLATEIEIPQISTSGSAFSNEVKVLAPDGKRIATYNVGKIWSRGEFEDKWIYRGHYEGLPITITSSDDDKSPS